MTKLIETECQGHVLIIRLNRPEARNAFNLAMAQEMSDTLDMFDADPELRVGIITGNGPSFCAGQDLIEAAQGKFAATESRGGFGIMTRGPDKPLIAAVEGHALAGGMELTLCCDLIVATTASVFGLAEVKRSLIALGGGVFRLPRRVPYHVAMEILLTAEPKPAAEMAAHGLVNRVVEPGQALATALELAAQIARNGPLAVKATKAIAAKSFAEGWNDADGWAKQMAMAMPVLTSEDLKEGLKAFAEKRDPVWTGR